MRCNFNFDYEEVFVGEFVKNITTNPNYYKDRCIKINGKESVFSHTSLDSYFKYYTNPTEGLVKKIPTGYSDELEDYIDLSNIKAIKVNFDNTIDYHFFSYCILPDYVYFESSGYNAPSIHKSKIKNLKLICNLKNGDDIRQCFWGWCFKDNIEEANIELAVNLTKSFERSKIRYINGLKKNGKLKDERDYTSYEYKKITDKIEKDLLYYISANYWDELKGIKINLVTNLDDEKLKILNFHKMLGKNANIIYDDFVEYYI